MNDCVNLNNKTEKFYITLSKLHGSRSYDRAAIATKDHFTLGFLAKISSLHYYTTPGL